MRLYLWRDCLCDYTEGVCFAVADSIDDARALVIATANPLYSTVKEAVTEKEPEIIEGPFGFHLFGGS